MNAEKSAREWQRAAQSASARADKAESERDEARQQLKQAQARIAELESYIDAHNKKALSFLDDALNSGDGVYRP